MGMSARHPAQNIRWATCSKYRQRPPLPPGVTAPSASTADTGTPLPKAVDALRTCAAGVWGCGRAPCTGILASSHPGGTTLTKKSCGLRATVNSHLLKTGYLWGTRLNGHQKKFKTLSPSLNLSLKSLTM